MRFADDVLPIFGDRVQLQQVMLNLLMNGLEAMSSISERARELVITTGNTDAGQVQITVEDSGTGLDPNTIERIFDPFYTTKPIGRGAGLGLSVVYGIVQDHQGQISCENRPEVGTVFALTFPIARQEVMNEDLAAAAAT